MIFHFTNHFLSYIFLPKKKKFQDLKKKDSSLYLSEHKDGYTAKCCDVFLIK